MQTPRNRRFGLRRFGIQPENFTPSLLFVGDADVAGTRTTLYGALAWLT